MPASVCSFAFGSARTSFLLDAFTTYTNGWIGRGTGVSPREDNLVGLFAALAALIPSVILARGVHAACVAARGSAVDLELYYEKIR